MGGSGIPRAAPRAGWGWGQPALALHQHQGRGGAVLGVPRFSGGGQAPRTGSPRSAERSCAAHRRISIPGL